MRSAPSILILVVEDDVILRFAAAQTLRQAGFIVLEACDVAEADALLAEHAEIAIVVTDVEMPGESGLDLARRLARDAPWISVLVTSGVAEPPKGLAFLPKPYMPSELIARVERAAEAGGLRQQARPRQRHQT